MRGKPHRFCTLSPLALHHPIDTNDHHVLMLQLSDTVVYSTGIEVGIVQSCHTQGSVVSDESGFGSVWSTIGASSCMPTEAEQRSQHRELPMDLQGWSCAVYMASGTLVNSPEAPIDDF
jgi:hypothetical protein